MIAYKTPKNIINKIQTIDGTFDSQLEESFYIVVIQVYTWIKPAIVTRITPATISVNKITTPKLSMKSDLNIIKINARTAPIYTTIIF